MINEKLKEYIESNIMPRNALNDAGHGLDHVNYVIRRSLAFASTLSDINLNMVYTVAAYHDVGHSIDAKNHEKVSAEILASDEKLQEFFSPEEIKIMSEAVEDHRASSKEEPRSIYGKIVSSADRNTSVNEALKRTYAYRVKHMPEASIEEIIKDSKAHILSKFGKDGYAREKMYFVDEEYEQFLHDADELASNDEEFKKAFIKVNEIDLGRIRIKQQ